MGFTGAPQATPTATVLEPLQHMLAPYLLSLPPRGLGDTGKLDVIALDAMRQELSTIGPAQEVRQTFPEEVDDLRSHPHVPYYMVRLKESPRALPVSPSPSREWWL